MERSDLRVASTWRRSAIDNRSSGLTIVRPLGARIQNSLIRINYPLDIARLFLAGALLVSADAISETRRSRRISAKFSPFGHPRIVNAAAADTIGTN